MVHGGHSLKDRYLRLRDLNKRKMELPEEFRYVLDGEIIQVKREIRRRTNNYILPELEEWRTFYDFDGELMYEHRFFDWHNLTEQEKCEKIEEMRIILTSPYDCSGDIFTVWISRHDNPNGLTSVVHAMARDY